MGIALSVEGGRPELLALAAAACRGWEAEAEPGASPLRLRLDVGQVAGDSGVRREGTRLWITGAQAQGWVDAERGEAACVIAEGCDERVVRETVLDPLLLVLVTRRDRTPIHAAAFLAGDMAVLLAGPSGSGKSCLALAAHRAGYAVLSDDIVYAQLRPELRIWSIPRPIHLFAEDAAGAATEGERFRNGKHKVALALPAPPSFAPVKRASLCVLRRGDGASLDPIGGAEALAELGDPEPGFDLLRDQSRAALGFLAGPGAWRLTLGADPADAIDLLGRNRARIASRAVP